MRSPVLHARTGSPEGTQALAAALAELAQPGDLLLLAGDLGAGKTAFTQGYGEALGVQERITSPTFTLVNHHRGVRLLLHHVDVYRLEQLDEVLDLGLEELLDGVGVTVIEWGDAIRPALPADYLEIELRLDDVESESRFVDLRLVGGRWAARRRAIGAAVGPWLLPDPLAGDDSSPGRLATPLARPAPPAPDEPPEVSGSC